MPATTLERIAEQAPTMTEAQRNWRIAAIALLSIRVIQGFIYWFVSRICGWFLAPAICQERDIERVL
jgi:hypothetical protein